MAETEDNMGQSEGAGLVRGAIQSAPDTRSGGAAARRQVFMLELRAGVPALGDTSVAGVLLPLEELADVGRRGMRREGVGLFAGCLLLSLTASTSTAAALLQWMAPGTESTRVALRIEGLGSLAFLSFVLYGSVAMAWAGIASVRRRAVRRRATAPELA